MKTFYIVTWMIVAMNVWYEPPPKPVYDKFGRNIAEKMWCVKMSIDSIRQSDTFTIKKDADSFLKELKDAQSKTDTGFVDFNVFPGKILNPKLTTVRR